MEAKGPLPQSIKERYESRLHSAFPLRDIKKLSSGNPDELNRLHLSIEMYLSGIAGYASSADHLRRRTRSALGAPQTILSPSFFERHPAYVRYRTEITQKETPDLLIEMEIAELNRIDLLKGIKSLL